MALINRIYLVTCILVVWALSVWAASESILFTTLLDRGQDYIVVDEGRLNVVEDLQVSDLNGLPMHYYEIKPRVRVELHVVSDENGNLTVKKIVVLEEKKPVTVPE